MVTTPGARTERGIGVGSSFDELESAYPNLRSWNIPENRCIAETDVIKGVSFRFSALCEDIDNQTRIDEIAVSKGVD